MIDGLQVAQAGRVGRGDVDDDKVDPVGERLRAVLVVRGGVFLRRHLVLADVGADDRGAARRSRAQLAQLLGGCVRSGVVETHAVTQAALRHETPQARRVVAGLWTGSHGANLDEGVAEGAHAEHGFGIFVHASRQTQARGQAALPQHQGDLDAADHSGGGVGRIQMTQRGAHESTRRGESSGQGNRPQTPVMCNLRV